MAIQREIEMRGLSTVLITVAPDESVVMRPPRALCPQGFPLGNSLGRPHQPAMQKKILRDALDLFLAPPAPGRIQERSYS